MTETLDIKSLLKGTEYEEKSDFISTKIVGWGLDNTTDIWNLPNQWRVFAGIRGNELVDVLVTQHEKNNQVSASPAAEKLAEEVGVSLADVEGSGNEGKVLKSDVQDLILEDQDNDDQNSG